MHGARYCGCVGAYDIASTNGLVNVWVIFIVGQTFCITWVSILLTFFSLEFCHLFIMIISFEKLLHTVLFKNKLVLFHLVRVSIFPLSVGVLWVEVVTWGRDKWRIYFFVVKVIPRVVREPNMVFKILRTVKTKPIHWLSLYKFIYKISCL